MDLTVFDSFDGADFIVKGSKIFDTNKKKLVKKFGYYIKENKNFNEDLNFYNQKINYTSSDTIHIPQQKNWDSKVNFLNYFTDTKGSYSNLEHETGNSSISYFVQYPNNDNTLNSYSTGFNYKKEFYNKKLNLILKYSDHKNLISDYSIIRKNNSLTNAKIYDYELIYKLNKNTDFFFRQSREYLSSENNSNYNFSIDSSLIQSETYGLEFKKNNLFLNTGLYKPSHFKSSNMTFLTPSGRNQNGDILWKEQHFESSNSLNYSPYVSFKTNFPQYYHNLRIII